MQPKISLFLLSTLSACIMQYTASAQGLTINNGGSVVVNGTANIVVNNGGISNAGTFNAGTGTVLFTGATAANISGTSNTAFYNFTIDKAGNTIKLLRNIDVTNTLGMTNGFIDLNGFDLNLGTTGSIVGENPNARVMGAAGGFLVKTATLNAPNKANPGNIGVEITTGDNLGLTTIKRGHQALQLSGNFGINRYFDINSTTPLSSNAILRFYYFDQELGNVLESELGVYSLFNTNPGGLLQQDNAFDPIANYIQLGGVKQLGRFVLASDISDPARSAYFIAVLVNGRTNLSWGTMYEINTDHFELERAYNGRDFQRFATIAASGTTSVSHNYAYTDPELITGPMYYRYKLVYKDGTVRYSNIVSVNIDGYPDWVLQVYPNPSTGPVNVRFSSSKDQKVILQVVDNLGHVFDQKEFAAVKGLNIATCDISKLAQGIYYIRVVNIEKRAHKVIKQ